MIKLDFVIILMIIINLIVFITLIITGKSLIQLIIQANLELYIDIFQLLNHEININDITLIVSHLNSKI